MCFWAWVDRAFFAFLFAFQTLIYNSNVNTYKHTHISGNLYTESQRKSERLYSQWLSYIKNSFRSKFLCFFACGFFLFLFIYFFSSIPFFLFFVFVLLFIPLEWNPWNNSLPIKSISVDMNRATDAKRPLNKTHTIGTKTISSRVSTADGAYSENRWMNMIQIQR